MSRTTSSTTRTTDFGTTDLSAAELRPAARSRARFWSWAVIATHVAFVAAWLIARTWQLPGYSAVDHSVSDMYAVTAPHAWFLLTVITAAGVAALGFVGFGLWPALRAAGLPARIGSVLLALSVFGLGDLLTPFERLACQRADPTCSSSDQVANFGGTLDSTLTTLGLVVMVASTFVLAAAMRRLPRWASWARPTRWFGVVLFLLLAATGVFSSDGPGGLFERLTAAFGAAGIVALGVGVLRATRPTTRLTAAG
ncbi:DUF998 domain-containing protein [Luteimicrobium sp. DT211]|uniref:DUF998 domain-containing protein n=1 Tax=Luteimicrobium sp. DT211 TaxID=3393412 RepID=UPI003CEEA322